MSLYTKESIKAFAFGALSFSVRNYRGVYFMSDAVKQQIRGLPSEEVRKANREAWKQFRASTRLANRHCNVSISGNDSIYEDAASHADVAQAVAKETYKVMMGYA